jgi:hypothetical protein
MQASAHTKHWEPIYFYLPLLLPIILFWDSFVHEGGHAAACILQGNKVNGWRLWIPAYTKCTGYNGMFYAAGTSASLVVWVACTLILTRWLLPQLRGRKCGLFIAAWWVEWSFWCLGELVCGALQVHSHPKTGIVPDTAQLAKVSGIHQC